MDRNYKNILYMVSKMQRKMNTQKNFISLLAMTSIFLWGACNKKNNHTITLQKPIYDFSPLDNFLAQNTTLTAFGGNACVLVLKDNDIIYEKSLGNLNRNSVNFVASASKLMSATAVLSLVASGKIQLDKRIGDYLPIYNLNNKGNPTIRQCFGMSSGFEECGNLISACVTNDQTFTLETAVNQIAQNVPLAYSQGNTLYYGSTGMHIVGRIAEIQSGKSWESLFRENVAIPCQMFNTNYNGVQNPLIAGGAKSSPIDLLNLLKMILNKGKVNNIQVISDSAINELFKPQVPSTIANVVYSPYPDNPPYLPYNPSKVYYGFGSWQEAITNNNVVEQISSPGLFGTYPYIDRKRNMAVVIFNFQNNGFNNAFLTELQIGSLIRQVVDNPKR